MTVCPKTVILSLIHSRSLELLISVRPVPHSFSSTSNSTAYLYLIVVDLDSLPSHRHHSISLARFPRPHPQPLPPPDGVRAPCHRVHSRPFCVPIPWRGRPVSLCDPTSPPDPGRDGARTCLLDSCPPGQSHNTHSSPCPEHAFLFYWCIFLAHVYRLQTIVKYILRCVVFNLSRIFINAPVFHPRRKARFCTMPPSIYRCFIRFPLLLLLEPHPESLGSFAYDIKYIDLSTDVNFPCTEIHHLQAECPLLDPGRSLPYPTRCRRSGLCGPTQAQQ